MTLPTTPPKYASFSDLFVPIKKDERGWRAYAVQSVVGVVADGIWGDQTDRAVKIWQSGHKLAADAIVGPVTQGAMVREAATTVDANFTVIPDGLLNGFARVEGADILAATNWYTPPGAPVGVDCGAGQIRILRKTDGTYPLLTADSVYGLKDVFNPVKNLTITARMFTGRIGSYKLRNPNLSRQQIVEAAVLAHNAPFLAEQIVKYGKLSTPNAIASWTTIPKDERAKYDGRLSYTHYEWSKEYPRRVLLGVSY